MFEPESITPNVIISVFFSFDEHFLPRWPSRISANAVVYLSWRIMEHVCSFFIFAQDSHLCTLFQVVVVSEKCVSFHLKVYNRMHSSGQQAARLIIIKFITVICWKRATFSSTLNRFVLNERKESRFDSDFAFLISGIIGQILLKWLVFAIIFASLKVFLIISKYLANRRQLA